MNAALFDINRWVAAQANPLAPTSGDIVGLIFLGAFVVLFAWMAYKFLSVQKKERLEALTKISNEAAAEAAREQAQAEAAQAQLGAPEAIPVPVAEKTTAPEIPATLLKETTAEPQKEPVAASEPPPPETATAPEPSTTAPATPVEEAPKKKSLFAALSSTRAGFVGKLSQILTGKGEIDEETLEDLEAALFSADIGAQTADRLLEAVRSKVKNKDLSSGAAITDGIKNEIVEILSGVSSAPLKVNGQGPAVVMVVGVNGAGKTTSIGKLTHQLQSTGKKVLLGAGDTFRAAAVEQLEIWGERNGVSVIKGKEGADPSSVLFDAVDKAKEESADVVLCDTAGRLHTKTNLMEELKKVHRVLGKAHDGAPH